MTDISKDTRVEIDEEYQGIRISQNCDDNIVFIELYEIPALIEALIKAENELGGGLE